MTKLVHSCMARTTSIVLLALAAMACDEDTLAADERGDAGRSAEATEQLLPEFPAKDVDTRTVRLREGSTDQLEFTTPQIPALRTSGDGRLGIHLADGGRLYVLRPERLQGHFTRSGPGVGELLATSGPSTRRTFLGNRFAEHLDTLSLEYDGHPLTYSRTAGTALCDPTYLQTTVSGQNPYRCTDDEGVDCYDLEVVSILKFDFERDEEVHELVTLASIPMHVEVTDAKTPEARISAMVYENPDGSPAEVTLNTSMIEQGLRNMMELNIVGDGRLAVGRIGYVPLSWTDDDGTQRLSDDTNMVYSVYPSSEEICDVTKWGTFYPIGHAPYDTTNAMPQRYGFAHHPFRDGTGALVPDGADIYGSYPWMDRRAANLFFEAIHNPFYRLRDGEVVSRYRDISDEVPTQGSEIGRFQDGNTRTMGVSVMGAWTQGKMVLLDGPLNNLDFPIRFLDPTADRKIDIYADYPEDRGFVWMGAGRERDFSRKPEGIVPPRGYVWPGNSSHIESLENKFNYSSNLTPTVPRDLVWYVSNSRVTQQVVFDHYVNPHVLISSEMVGALALVAFEPERLDLYRHGRDIRDRADTADEGYIAAHYLSYKDGTPFGDFRFSEIDEEPVLVQNAAGTRPTVMATPRFGEPVPAHANVRIEPVAMGGVFGKGLWLDGDSGLRYEVPNEGEVNAERWYVGLFVDRRGALGDGARIRTLFEVAPADPQERRVRIGLHGPRSIVLLRERNDGQFHEVRNFTLGEDHFALVREHWHHLGFAVEPDGEGFGITILYDGYAVHRWTSMLDGFPIGPGTTVTLGRPETGSNGFEDNGTAYLPPHEMPGFRGWLDDFRVLADVPTLEELCNEARGTLILPTPGSYWHRRGSAYPMFAHDEVGEQIASAAGQIAVCYHRNNQGQDLAALDQLPSGSISLREAVMFPDGDGLEFGAPRPDSSQTEYCLSCHTDEETELRSLRMDALLPSERRLPSGGLRAMQWDKRQPLQPPRKIWGVMRDTMVDPDGDPTPWPRGAPDRHMVDSLLH